MTEKSKFELPPDELALEMIGSVLIGVGLADGFGNTAIVPESLQLFH